MGYDADRRNRCRYDNGILRDGLDFDFDFDSIIWIIIWLAVTVIFLMQLT